jgi:hypothetical protein
VNGYKEILRKYKPGASTRTHLLVAASVWAAVGISLFLRGWFGFSEEYRILLTFGGMAVGTLKTLLVMDRAARGNILRIIARKEGRCIGGVYSARMWGLVLLMILGGRLLRVFGSAELTWFLYLAVGWALLLSSRLIWQHWRFAGRRQNAI